MYFVFCKISKKITPYYCPCLLYLSKNIYLCLQYSLFINKSKHYTFLQCYFIIFLWNNNTHWLKLIWSTLRFHKSINLKNLIVTILNIFIIVDGCRKSQKSLQNKYFLISWKRNFLSWTTCDINFIWNKGTSVTWFCDILTSWSSGVFHSFFGKNFTYRNKPDQSR